MSILLSDNLVTAIFLWKIVDNMDTLF